MTVDPAELRVQWTPLGIPGWSHSDASTNPFTAAEDGPTEVPDFYRYSAWCQVDTAGTVVAVSDADWTVTVRLDQPLDGMALVAYDRDCVQGHRGFEAAIDAFLRSTTKDGCYEYERGCRCEACLRFERHEGGHDSPTANCPWCR
jgi:hypothetical protein